VRIRESGMPDEAAWAGFFEPADVLARLGLTSACVDAVDFGCGYGTFAIPAARIVSGTVYAIDVEPAMVRRTHDRARAEGLGNVTPVLRDFLDDGTGLPDESVDYAMLFNILHAENPMALLEEAMRILKPAGLAAIMHWNYDSSTPRGPSMDIRPRPEQCLAWAVQAGLRPAGEEFVSLPPHHYGLVLRKTR